MKIIDKILSLVALVALVMWSPTQLMADDGEIFFAKAAASDEENRPSANVMLLLDTSGSMRNCKTSDGSEWCDDYKERRINLLVNAVNKLLDDVQDGVNIGISRFRNDSSYGNTGARILVPVTEVNEESKRVLKAQVAALNSAGTADSGEGDPVGGTPTAEAYMEVTNYMMGWGPYYDSSTDRSMCVAEGVEEFNCVTTDVTTYPNYVELVSPQTCDPSLASCNVVYGDWVDIAGSCDTTTDTCKAPGWQKITGACDTSSSDCRETGDYGPWYDIPGDCNKNDDDCQRLAWTEWVVTISSGANRTNCPKEKTKTFERERDDYEDGNKEIDFCRERTRQYQKRDFLYEQRSDVHQVRTKKFFESEPVVISERVCETRPVCVKTQPVVSGGKYVSPMNMNNECETNHVVIFTDGSPSSDDPYRSAFTTCRDNGSYQCQAKVSKYLSGDNNEKKRPVKTYNIGLHMGNNLANMQSVSTTGATGTFNATDAKTLGEAFNGIFSLISTGSRSFASPGVAVNQLNRLQHLDQLYYAVFEPKKSSVWEGNLKRFAVENSEIHGQDGPAVDPDTGFFDAAATSFWTTGKDAPDGPDVSKGGARQQLASRKLVYTDSAGAMQTIVDWDAETNETLFGLPLGSTTAELDALKDQLKTVWGDPLHSEPSLVNYGGTSENNIVFVSTNAGMLHAVDTRTGLEKLAFMPWQLIQKADEFTVNRKGLAADNSRQTYGMDSSWTPWRRPGATPLAAPSAVYLYGGMRRGGYSYFALDVTNLGSPSLLWQIDRGQAGFERLGQTWSQPTLIQVMVSGTKTPALVFGGGYSPADHDSKQGDARKSSGDAMGNSIYVVNAVTGDLLWTAGANVSGAKTKTVSAMKWGIPSTLSAVDFNLDGVADNLYFGDLGGQLFRVDLDGTNITASSVHLLARLAGSGGADNRRFYNAPAVAYQKDEVSGEKALFVTIGSGYRAHPLDETVNDYFYVIKDSGALVGAAPETVYTPSDLTTLSTDSTVSSFSDNGWQLSLDGAGEKSTSSPVVFDSRIFFTSYEPQSEAGVEACNVRAGTSYLYVADLVTGVGASIGGEVATRKRQLKQDVPPPTPALISDGDSVLIVIGAEVAGAGDITGGGVRRGSWYQLHSGDADVVPAP